MTGPQHPHGMRRLHHFATRASRRGNPCGRPACVASPRGELREARRRGRASRAVSTSSSGVLARLDVRQTLDRIEDGLSELEHLEARGLAVLNRPLTLRLAHDKRASAGALAAASIPHPRTRALFGADTPAPRLRGGQGDRSDQARRAARRMAHERRARRGPGPDRSVAGHVRSRARRCTRGRRRPRRRRPAAARAGAATSCSRSTAPSSSHRSTTRAKTSSPRQWPRSLPDPEEARPPVRDRRSRELVTGVPYES